MSTLLVADYQRRIAELVQYGGSANEDSIRKAFARLLDDIARPHDLRLIEELEGESHRAASARDHGQRRHHAHRRGHAGGGDRVSPACAEWHGIPALRSSRSLVLSAETSGHQSGPLVMERKTVSSSSVRSIGYDRRLRRLEVQFVNGGIYQYFGVPPIAHERLIGAPSIGAHMNRTIKPRYRYRRVS